MRRRLFTIFSAMTLLMSMATVMLWVRSQHYREGCCIARANWGIVLHVSGGQAYLQWLRAPHGEGSFCWNMDVQGRMDPMSIAEPRAFGATDYYWYTPVDQHGPWPAIMLPRQGGWHGFAFHRSSWKAEEFVESPLAFNLQGYRGSALLRYMNVGLPIWAVALAMAVVPAAHSAAMLRRRCRHGPGQCANCGYDLRASPERCPECGTIRTERSVEEPPIRLACNEN